MGKLNETEISEHMKALPEWELGEDRIKRSFRFKDFVEAFGWMSSVALIATATQQVVNLLIFSKNDTLSP